MTTLDRPNAEAAKKESAEELKLRYRYWRIRIFYSIYIGYIFFYFTRKSFTFAMPGLMSNLGFDEESLGFLSSLLAISYGCSKFVSGLITDRGNLRYVMGVGLILTGVLNICFGFSSSIALFALFLGLNGFFQGWGSPPCAKLLTAWYSQGERGRWWGIWNTSHNIGGAAIPYVVALCIWLIFSIFGGEITSKWRLTMHLPGLLAIVCGFFLINRLRSDPKEVALPPIEEFKENDFAKKQEVKSDKKLKTKEILLEYVLKNRFIWLLAASFFCVYFLRQAINEWMMIYLTKQRGYSDTLAGSCISFFEIGGIFGSLTAGSLSDTFFSGKRGPVNVLFTVGVLLTLSALWLMPGGSWLFFSTTLFVFGFFIFGPQMLIGMVAAEMASKEAAGTATGFVGFFAYLGASFSGWPVGYMVKHHGWSSFFPFLSVCALVAIFLLLPLWSKGARAQVAAKAV